MNLNNPIVGSYLREIGRRPLLDQEQERGLARRIRRGCREARDELIGANLSFVVKIAKEYRNRGLPFEDLLNEGNLGLILASERFDPNRGHRFVTFAIWWIRKTILCALREHGNGVIRVADSQQRRLREVCDAEDVLRANLGREPRRDEVAHRLGSKSLRLDEWLHFRIRESSLSRPVSDDERLTLAETVADSERLDPAADLLHQEARTVLSEAVEELPQPDRRVIRERYGLDETPRLKLSQIGQAMGLSRERVRQIETRGRQRLRRILARRRWVDRPVRDENRRGPAATSKQQPQRH